MRKAGSDNTRVSGRPCGICREQLAFHGGYNEAADLTHAQRSGVGAVEGFIILTGCENVRHVCVVVFGSLADGGVVIREGNAAQVVSVGR